MPELKVRQVFEEAYGSLPEGAELFVAAYVDYGYSECSVYEIVYVCESEWYYLAFYSLHGGTGWKWESFAGPYEKVKTIGDCVNDCDAKAFVGFFGFGYIRAYEEMSNG